MVGAGPAGLEAARVLDQMGHQVILLEKETRIGGQVNLAARPPGKEEFRYIIDFYRESLKLSGVDLRLGVEADARAVLDLAPDVVVVATGSVPPGTGPARDHRAGNRDRPPDSFRRGHGGPSGGHIGRG